MFGIKRQDAQLNTITLNIDGMHCVSCAMNIDGELEELDGVISAETNFAKAETRVTFETGNIDAIAVRSTIESLGYAIKP